MPTLAANRSSFSVRGLLSLALPMIISRAGLAAMDIADGVMVSRFQFRQFALLSLAEGTQGRLLDVLVAFLLGSLAFVPRQFGQGDGEGARALWLRTLPVAIALGAVGLIVSVFGKSLLMLMGQGPELSAGAAPLMLILGAGYPAALLAISAAVYLEGTRHPGVVAASVVTANLLNIALNWVLIGGQFGVPAMGARGSALSTTMVRFALCLVLVSFAGRKYSSQTIAITDSISAERAASRRSQWRMGLGSAATVAATVLLTSSLTIFAGWLGVVSLATFSAAWNLAGPAALIGLGMADATGISVGIEAGRRGERGAASVAWPSLLTTLIPVALILVAITVRKQSFIAFYAKDTVIRQNMAPLIPLVALTLLTDCFGFVMASSLRAIREIAWPAGIEIGSMVLLVCFAASLTLWRGYGVRGLLLAMLGAAVTRSGMLAGRFWWRTQSIVPPPPGSAQRLEIPY